MREFDAHIAAGLSAGRPDPGEASVLQTLGEAIGEDIVLAGAAGLPPTRLAEQVEAELAAFEPGSSVALWAGTGGGYPERLGLLQDRLARMTEVGEPFLVERHQVFVQARIGKYQALKAQAQAQGDVALLRAYRDERALFEATQVRLAQRAIELDYRHAALRFAERLSASGDAAGFSHPELVQAAQRLAAGQSTGGQAVDAYLRTRMAQDDTRLYLTVLGQGSIGSLVGLDGAGIAGVRLRPEFGPTRPTGSLGSQPGGTPETIRPNANAETKRGIRRQNEAAEILAGAGYRVEHREHAGASGVKNPDLLVEGRIFDVYSPAPETSAVNMMMAMGRKSCSNQTSRIVLNLADSNVTRHELRGAFIDYPIGVQEVIVIGRDRVIYRLP